MKLLFDQNLSRKLIGELSELYPGSAHLLDLDLAEATDRQVWKYAAEQNFVVVSKDDDFRQLSFLYGAPPKVIWLRVGNGPTSIIRELLLENLVTIERFVDNDVETLLVLPGLEL